MISVNEANAIIRQNLPVLGEELVPLVRSLGYVLADDVHSDTDMPPFNKSAMDGYAVVADDTAENGKEFVVLGEVAAGEVYPHALTSGYAVKIMTGAPLPDGADAVVMKENAVLTEKEERTVVSFSSPVSQWENVCLRGEDMKTGSVVLNKGTVIRPQELGVLASVGVDKVKIMRRPMVSIVTTGSELVEVTTRPTGGKIRNSNAYVLAGQLLNMNVPYAYLGIIEDESDLLRAKVREGLSADVLILTGGVSVGDYDIVENILKEEGVEIFITRVAMKPGKPFLFGKKDDKLVFGLAGNPVSAFVAFEVFVSDALTQLMGRTDAVKKMTKCRLSAPYNVVKNRQQYVPALLYCADGSNGQLPAIKPVEWHSSADITSYTKANALMVVPSGEGNYNADDVVDAIVL